MMIFGRSLFGGTTSGHVLVVGLASALVSAVAVPEVTRPVHGTGYAQSVVQADALKAVVPAGTTAQVSGYAAGRAQVDFSGYVAAEALASGYGKGTADYLLAGDALAQFNYLAIASKRTRAPYALAWANASGEADAQIYEYAYSAPAVGRAYGVGTTYHVGRTHAKPMATGEAAVSIIAGAATQAIAAADVVGECKRMGGASGLALGIVSNLVDASVTREGVREFELVGFADCTTTATVANVGVYQLQTTEAYAYASQPDPVHTKGAKSAVAVMRATGQGIAVGTITAVAAIPGDSVTAATGKAAYRFGGFSMAQASAVASGRVAIQYPRSGTALAVAEASLDRVVLGYRAYATGESFISADYLRTVYPEGTASAVAHAPGFMQVNDLSKAPDDRTLVLAIEDRLVSVETQPRLILI